MTDPQKPITWDGVRSRMVGMGSWLRAAAASEAQYDERHIVANVIPARIREFEMQTNFTVLLKQIVSRPDGAYNGQGVVLPDGSTNNLRVVTRDGMPYRDNMARQFFHIALHERPVQLLQRVRIMLNDILVYQVPPDWFNLEVRTGKAHLLPTYGPLLVSNVAALAVLSTGFGNLQYVPGAINCDYVAGLPAGWQFDPEWMHLKQSLEEFCAAQVYQDVQNMADAGLISKNVSGDGTGESFSYDRFEKRIAQLEAKSLAFRDDFTGQEVSPLLGFV
jgi:hypothetical protein